MSTAAQGILSDTPEALPDVCPVSGLPVQSRPDWVYTNPQQTYRTTIALIGEAIFWVIPRGYITDADMAAATALASAILAEVPKTRTPFVLIENFAHTQGGTVAARRRYLRFTNTLEGLLGSFPYGMPPFFRLSFNFSRRLQLHRYRVHMVAHYEDAVRAALEMLNRHGVAPGVCCRQPPSGPPQGVPPTAGGDRDAARPSGAGPGDDLTLCAEALLAYLGHLDLESPGIPDPPDGFQQSPLHPVYEALAMLKLDMDLFMEEQRTMVADLQDRRRQLLDKSASIENRNRELQILLQQSSDDQAAFGHTVRHNVETLLKPVLELIDRDAAQVPRAAGRQPLDADIDRMVGERFPCIELGHYRLTARELHIARLIRDGARSRGIARQLGVSVRTVESFRRRLRAKLGLRGKPQNLRTVLQALPDDELRDSGVSGQGPHGP
jgi:DNA-binding CsgD family transcriptional regulator